MERPDPAGPAPRGAASARAMGRRWLWAALGGTGCAALGAGAGLLLYLVSASPCVLLGAVPGPAPVTAISPD